MSEKFRAILRTKSAEQLINMRNNQKDWDANHMCMIQDEISNRGIEIFEEPNPWNEEEMNELDLENPKTDFEKNLAYLKKETVKTNKQSGISLISQILSIASVIVSFISYYYLSLLGEKVIMIILFCLFLSIASLVTFVKKFYLVTIIIGSVSLFILLGLVLSNWENVLV